MSIEVSLIKTPGMSYTKFSWTLSLLAEGPLLPENCLLAEQIESFLWRKCQHRECFGLLHALVFNHSRLYFECLPFDFSFLYHTAFESFHESPRDALWIRQARQSLAWPCCLQQRRS